MKGGRLRDTALGVVLRGIVLGLWELAAGTKRLGGKRRGLWVTGRVEAKEIGSSI